MELSLVLIVVFCFQRVRPTMTYLQKILEESQVRILLTRLVLQQTPILLPLILERHTIPWHILLILHWMPIQRVFVLFFSLAQTNILIMSVVNIMIYLAFSFLAQGSRVGMSLIIRLYETLLYYLQTTG